MLSSVCFTIWNIISLNQITGLEVWARNLPLGTEVRSNDAFTTNPAPPSSCYFDRIDGSVGGNAVRKNSRPRWIFQKRTRVFLIQRNSVCCKDWTLWGSPTAQTVGRGPEGGKVWSCVSPFRHCHQVFHRSGGMSFRKHLHPGQKPLGQAPGYGLDSSRWLRNGSREWGGSCLLHGRRNHHRHVQLPFGSFR